jgi:hypothetical protein
MKLSNIIAVLEDTIAQKTKYLAEQEEAIKVATLGEEIALHATIEFVKMNVGELSRIVADLKKVEEI